MTTAFKLDSVATDYKDEAKFGMDLNWNEKGFQQNSSDKNCPVVSKKFKEQYLIKPELKPLSDELYYKLYAEHHNRYLPLDPSKQDLVRQKISNFLFKSFEPAYPTLSDQKILSEQIKAKIDQLLDYSKSVVLLTQFDSNIDRNGRKYYNCQADMEERGGTGFFFHCSGVKVGVMTCNHVVFTAKEVPGVTGFLHYVTEHDNEQIEQRNEILQIKFSNLLHSSPPLNPDIANFKYADFSLMKISPENINVSKGETLTVLPIAEDPPFRDASCDMILEAFSACKEDMKLDNATKLIEALYSLEDFKQKVVSKEKLMEETEIFKNNLIGNLTSVLNANLKPKGLVNPCDWSIIKDAKLQWDQALYLLHAYLHRSHEECSNKESCHVPILVKFIEILTIMAAIYPDRSSSSALIFQHLKKMSLHEAINAVVDLMYGISSASVESILNYTKWYLKIKNPVLFRLMTLQGYIVTTSFAILNFLQQNLLKNDYELLNLPCCETLKIGTSMVNLELRSFLLHQPLNAIIFHIILLEWEVYSTMTAPPLQSFAKAGFVDSVGLKEKHLLVVMQTLAVANKLWRNLAVEQPLNHLFLKKSKQQQKKEIERKTFEAVTFLEILNQQAIFIVSHPHLKSKKLSMGVCYASQPGEHHLFYDSVTTCPGSSGAPVVCIRMGCDGQLYIYLLAVHCKDGYGRLIETVNRQITHYPSLPAVREISVNETTKFLIEILDEMLVKLESDNDRYRALMTISNYIQRMRIVNAAFVNENCLKLFEKICERWIPTNSTNVKVAINCVLRAALMTEYIKPILKTCGKYLIAELLLMMKDDAVNLAYDAAYNLAMLLNCDDEEAWNSIWNLDMKKRIAATGRKTVADWTIEKGQQIGWGYDVQEVLTCAVNSTNPVMQALSLYSLACIITYRPEDASALEWLNVFQGFKQLTQSHSFKHVDHGLKSYADIVLEKASIKTSTSDLQKHLASPAVDGRQLKEHLSNFFTLVNGVKSQANFCGALNAVAVELLRHGLASATFVQKECLDSFWSICEKWCSMNNKNAILQINNVLFGAIQNGIELTKSVLKYRQMYFLIMLLKMTEHPDMSVAIKCTHTVSLLMNCNDHEVWKIVNDGMQGEIEATLQKKISEWPISKEQHMVWAINDARVEHFLAAALDSNKPVAQAFGLFWLAFQVNNCRPEKIIPILQQRNADCELKKLFNSNLISQLKKFISVVLEKIQN